VVKERERHTDRQKRDKEKGRKSVCVEERQTEKREGEKDAFTQIKRETERKIHK
jgi:hypothetical protein